ncbi:inositol-trisphosphate 3-kinase like protein [Ditylenchus destructor]|uniref:Inositol-trisphosphate 3-kinase like protein n=1 Tax=Ditylenchus destructor TaxID=166010 RepID=A0AAD4MWW3_9BILA|nr:inositol-trisphosphate 3-kinase like protein [Ditylenchus destructor]
MAILSFIFAFIARIFSSNWDQLAGHAGALIQGTTRRILKKMPPGDKSEALNYEAIMADPDMSGLTPRFFKLLDYMDNSYLELEDLLWHFPNASDRFIMDLKMGTR